MSVVKHNKKRAMLLQGHHMMQHIFAYTQLSCYLHDSLLFTFHETLILASYRNRITAKYKSRCKCETTYTNNTLHCCMLSTLSLFQPKFWCSSWSRSM